MKALTKAALATLTLIVAGTQSATGFAYVTDADFQKLVKERPGVAEINKSTIDPTDATKFAARSTDAGNAELKTDNAPATVLSFPVLSGIVKPAKSRGALGKTSIYPFESMNVGQCIFIENTTEKPDAPKSVASTVGSANIRLAKLAKVGEGYKVFAVYRVTENSEQSKMVNGKTGALIFREADGSMTADYRTKLDKPKTAKTPATPATPPATEAEATAALAANA